MIHTDHMRIDPAYLQRMHACGLDSVERVLSRTEGRVAAWSRSTETLYVSCADGEPGFYVKRYYYAAWNKRIRGMFRGTFFGKHRGQAEFQLLCEMRGLGLPTIRPVAYGARRIMHFVTACFLITEEVPAARNLTAFAGDVREGRIQLTHADRRRVMDRLAKQVAELHAARFAHGQLFWRNILIRFDPIDQPEFFFLDVRPRHGGRQIGRKGRWWLHDLCHLAVSALPFTTRVEQVRFLKAYFKARHMSPNLNHYLHEIARLSRRWTKHERQRIKMNNLFEDWNRQLQIEDAKTTDPPQISQGAGS